jgi:homoserine kinase
VNKRVRAWAPATVANVACGFDVLGFAVEGIGDEVRAWRSDEPGVRIESIEGDGGALPLDAEANTAGIAAAAVLEAAGSADGIVLHVKKGVPPSGGLGSSAASAVAGAVASDALLGSHLSQIELLTCALRGETAVSGAPHADNIAPCLYGGFVLVHVQPLRMNPLPVPDGLACALVRPHIEVSTREARAVLPRQIPIEDVVRQTANIAALIHGLHTADFDQIASALADHIAEPTRKPAVPGFDDMIRAALKAGALGGSLSGSGPTVFALCRSVDDARRVARAMADACPGDEADIHVSRVGAEGARVVVETT